MDQIVEEQVDIIDRENKVVDTVAKSVAHHEGLLHRIVIGELKNSRGEYCFVRQSSGRQDGGQFVSPIGGHVSAGESLEHALVRETQEEAGITPKKFHLVGQTLFNREVIGRKENHLFFVYEIETDETPILNHESIEFRWFSIEGIKETLKTNPQLFGAAWNHVYQNLYPEIYMSN
jgi:isopentenyl-diphosphate delta-isomerase